MPPPNKLRNAGESSPRVVGDTLLAILGTMDFDENTKVAALYTAAVFKREDVCRSLFLRWGGGHDLKEKTFGMAKKCYGIKSPLILRTMSLS